MKVAIICATPRGGHIEHAMNLALAIHTEIADAGGTCVLVSRNGATSYLPTLSGDCVQILESLSSKSRLWERIGRSGIGRPVRLVWETAILWRLVRTQCARFDLLVLEEPKYWIPKALRGRTRLAIIVHNAIEHDDQSRSPRTTLNRGVKRFVTRRADGVIVHGTTQADKLASALRLKSPAHEHALPGVGEVEMALAASKANGMHVPRDLPDQFALCIGALRENKGFDVAMTACGIHGLPLLVSGEPVPIQYGEHLAALSSRYPSVTLERRFLTPHEFGFLLSVATVVVIPYRRFDAGSGVVERARAVGTQLVVSDLPSLMAQCGVESDVTYFRDGDTEDLAAKVRTALSRPKRASGAPIEIDPRWQTLGRLVLRQAINSGPDEADRRSAS